MASRLQIVEFVSAASIKGVRVVVPCSLATSAPLPFLSLSLFHGMLSVQFSPFPCFRCRYRLPIVSSNRTL